MKLTTIIGIERSRDMPIKLTPPDGSNTPLWKLKLWIDEYNPGLPFFSPAEKAYPMVRYEVSSVRIDQTEYLKTNLARCYQYDESWCYDPDDDSILYIHFKDHLPPMVFYSRKFGVMYGYTNNGYKKVGNFQQAYELVQSLPSIEQSADPLEYGKMKFKSGNVTLDNTGKDFDEVLNVFGYDLSILVGEKEKDYSTYKRLEQYYISNYDVTPEKATFYGKDKRELLSQKAPNARFAQTDPPNDVSKYIPGTVYPYISDDLIDTVIPDAYGYCYRVPGICLNENQAISDRWRHFRFSRKITSLLTDADFILEAEIGKKWVRLPRNAAEYGEMGFQGTYDPATMWLAAGPVEYDSYNPVDGNTYHVNWTEEGTVTIPVIWAHDQEGQTWATDVEGGINDVRLSAKFNPQENPLDILLDLFEYYGGVEPVPERYDLDEMEYELRRLPPIGIALTEEKSLYDIVSSFQNGSLLGFQLLGKFDRYTARMDNPNRPTSFHLSSKEIINFDKLKIDFGGTNYATWTDIEYAKGYQDDKGLHAINKNFQRSLLDIHRFDKQYGNVSCLPDKETAELKALVFMRIFTNQLVSIKGIELFGLEYFNLQLYETGYMDLRGIRNRALLTDQDIRVMITNIKKNPATGIVTIDVIRREIVNDLPPEYST
jgi:hypothetical protein